MKQSEQRLRRISVWWMPATGIVCLGVGAALVIAWYHPRVARLNESLTTQQLSAAIGIHWWEFTIPENDGTQYLRFEFQDGETVKAHGGSSGWAPGERVIVTLRRDMPTKKLECSILGADGTNYWEVLDDPFWECATFVYALEHNSVNDRWIMKGNRTGGVTIGPDDAMSAGDVVLRLVMEPR